VLGAPVEVVDGTVDVVGKVVGDSVVLVVVVVGLSVEVVFGEGVVGFSVVVSGTVVFFEGSTVVMGG